MRELVAGEVDEGQVVEAGGDGGVVLDEGPPAGVQGEELMHGSVVAQQAAVRPERQAAQVAPGQGRKATPTTDDLTVAANHRACMCVCVCAHDHFHHLCAYITHNP